MSARLFAEQLSLVIHVLWSLFRETSTSSSSPNNSRLAGEVDPRPCEKAQE